MNRGATGIFLGTTERPFTRRDGSSAVARNISLQVEGEGAGQIYVADEHLFKSAQAIKPGTRVELGFSLALFRGEFSARLASIRQVQG